MFSQRMFALALAISMGASASPWGGTASAEVKLPTTLPLTFKSHSGDTSVKGYFLGFDGDFIRLDTQYGVLSFRATDMRCEGGNCPDLKNFREKTIFAGAPQIAQDLMPTLIAAFAQQDTLKLVHKKGGNGESIYALSDAKTKALQARFVVQPTSTKAGFDAYIAKEINVVLADRLVNKSETQRGLKAGLGNLHEDNRTNVIGLNGLVPITAPSRPDIPLTLTQLSQILSGKITDWSELAPQGIVAQAAEADAPEATTAQTDAAQTEATQKEKPQAEKPRAEKPRADTTKIENAQAKPLQSAASAPLPAGGDAAQVKAPQTPTPAPPKIEKAPITAHILAPTTATGRVIEEKLLTPFKAKLSKKVVQHPDAAALRAAVAKDPNALGITLASKAQGVQILAIKGSCDLSVKGTSDRIKAQDYPLSLSYLLYLPDYRQGPVTRRFFRFLNSPEAQKIIRDFGLFDKLPHSTPVPQRVAQLQEMMTSEQTESSAQDLQDIKKRLSTMQRLSVSFRFDEGSIHLDTQSRSNIQLISAAIANGLYEGRRLILAGFTDGVGDADKNLELSQQRAETVKHALLDAMGGVAQGGVAQGGVAQGGVARGGITFTSVGFGEGLPIACDEDAWGRQANRRVEMWLE